MTTIRVLSTLGLLGAMPSLAEQYESESGTPIDADFAPTVALLQRLRAGEIADIAILTTQGIDDMIAEGVIRPGTRTDIARSFVGIAVKAGAPRPDIASVAAFKATLLAARSVCYSKICASGIFFASLIERMGIAPEINARAVIAPSGFTAERLASGQCDLAVQQISELMVVPGIDVVGPLPAEIQTTATFSAGILASSTQSAKAINLLRFLAAPEIAPILRRTGLEPA
jgi:molybdate transport system substrate-binding protein